MPRKDSRANPDRPGAHDEHPVAALQVAPPDGVRPDRLKLYHRRIAESEVGRRVEVALR